MRKVFFSGRNVAAKLKFSVRPVRACTIGGEPWLGFEYRAFAEHAGPLGVQSRCSEVELGFVCADGCQRGRVL